MSPAVQLETFSSPFAICKVPNDSKISSRNAGKTQIESIREDGQCRVSPITNQADYGAAERVAI
jgi:hypothetical protein